MAKDLVTTIFYGCKITDEQWIKYARNELKDEIKSEDDIDINDDNDVLKYIYCLLSSNDLSKKN